MLSVADSLHRLLPRMRSAGRKAKGWMQRGLALYVANPCSPEWRGCTAAARLCTTRVTDPTCPSELRGCGTSSIAAIGRHRSPLGGWHLYLRVQRRSSSVHAVTSTSGKMSLSCEAPTTKFKSAIFCFLSVLRPPKY